MSLINLSILMIILIFIESAIALIVSYGFHGYIYRKENSISVAMRRLKEESPKAAFTVKVCYTLIIIEFMVVVFAKYMGVE